MRWKPAPSAGHQINSHSRSSHDRPDQHSRPSQSARHDFRPPKPTAHLELDLPNRPVGLSAEEEIANTITHGLGFVLSVFGALVMADTLGGGDGWRVAGCAIFVTSMIAVYAMSTLSHIFQSPRLRTLFRAIDQGTIYLLIAGTYTPFSLAYLHSTPWWILLGAVWAVAALRFRLEGALRPPGGKRLDVALPGLRRACRSSRSRRCSRCCRWPAWAG